MAKKIPFSWESAKFVDGFHNVDTRWPMRKFVLYSSVVFFVFCGKKPEPIQNAVLIEKYVQVKDGLNVRQTPDLKGVRIATLANRTKVTVLETKSETFKVGEISGSWTKISDGKIQGWAFGGFLSSDEPPGDPGSTECENAKEAGRREYAKCVDEAMAENDRLCPAHKTNCEGVAPSSACGAPEIQIEQRIKKICGDNEPVSLR